MSGMHFLPYSWLHRTRIYVVLGAVIAVGSFALILAMQLSAYSYILLFVGVAYLVAAPLVYQHAQQVVAGAGAH